MTTVRQRRVNELLQQELLMLLPGRVDDPRLVQIVVTRVETTQDMSTSKVYFTTAGPADDAQIEDMMDGLEHARSFLRSELTLLGLRRLPRLVFARDRDFESGKRVLTILDGLAPAKAETDKPESSGGDQPPGIESSRGFDEPDGTDSNHGDDDLDGTAGSHDV